MGFGVHLGWDGLIAGVGYQEAFLDGEGEDQHQIVMDLVYVGAARWLARKRFALHHSHVHVLQGHGRDGRKSEVSDVGIDCLELILLLLDGGRGDFLLRTADVEVMLGVLFDKLSHFKPYNKTASNARAFEAFECASEEFFLPLKCRNSVGGL